MSYDTWKVRIVNGEQLELTTEKTALLCEQGVDWRPASKAGRRRFLLCL